jgi:hypothetical protein
MHFLRTQLTVCLRNLSSQEFRFSKHCVLLKNSVFWDVSPCDSIVFLRSVSRLIVSANVVPSSPILVTLMMAGLISSETSVLSRATRRKILEDAILHTHRRENVKSYIALTGCTV